MEAVDHKRILVVDDSATMRMLIRTILKKTFPGVTVTEAVNGADAVEKLKDAEADLMLTDLMMPEMDGVELIRWVRGKYGGELPIIIITTESEEKERELGGSLGVEEYITKPIKSRELKESIERLLQ